MNSKTGDQDLEALARRGRWLAISTVAGSGAGHVGGPFSAMDMMVALYFRVMKIRPEEPKWPERDSLHVPSIKPVNKEEIVNAAGKAKVVTRLDADSADWRCRAAER